MTCPEEVRVQLLTILTIGIRSIRSCCETGQYGRCKVEATHIHNIPELMQDFSADKLGYYLEIEAPEYVRDIGGNPVRELRAPWESLKHWHAESRRTDG